MWNIAFFLSVVTTCALSSPFLSASERDNTTALMARGEVGVYFHNQHFMAMHISGDWAGSDKVAHPGLTEPYEIVQPGETVFIPALLGTRPKYFVGPVDNRPTAKVGCNRDSNSAVEVCFGGFERRQYYDLDLEKGFSVPIWCRGDTEKPEEGSGCRSDLLARCPEQYRHHNAETGIYDFCLGDPTNLEFRKRECPSSYTLFNQKRTRTLCDGSSTFFPTFLGSFLDILLTTSQS